MSEDDYVSNEKHEGMCCEKDARIAFLESEEKRLHDELGEAVRFGLNAKTRIKELEAEVARLKAEMPPEGSVFCNPYSCPKPVLQMEDERVQLKKENARLREDNERLKAQGPMPGLTDEEICIMSHGCSDCYSDSCQHCRIKPIMEKLQAELARRQAQKKEPDHCPECGSKYKKNKLVLSDAVCDSCREDLCDECGNVCTNAWHDERKG